MTKAVVDTHALIWFLEQNRRLGRRAREILLAPSSELVVPVIVLGELCYYLRKKKKGALYQEIYARLKHDPRITFTALEPDLILKIPETLEMHDGIIAATHLELSGSLILSKDDELKKWKGEALVWE